MLTIQNTIKNFSIDDIQPHLPFPLEKTIFLDIETTGFSAGNSLLYLIGCITFTNSGCAEYTQFFCDDKNETTLLDAFKNFSKDYSVMVYFNGQTFDIPFLKHKFEKSNLSFDFEVFEQYDLYKKAKEYKRVLPLANLKQKSLEEFFGLKREDMFSGGELIELYHTYLKTKSEKLLQTLLLHNAEDIEGMLTLLHLYRYDTFFLGNFIAENAVIQDYTAFDESKKQELLITLALNSDVPARISGRYGDFYFFADKNHCKIRAEVYNNKVRFYFSDYKNYYYLPQEDTAIHKSVAFYVDKAFRKQAKAENCYQWITINEDFLNHSSKLSEYALMAIKQVLLHG